MNVSQFSDFIQQRDNYTCQICKSPSMHAHHIMRRQYCDPFDNIPQNGIALCRSCHLKLHGKGKLLWHDKISVQDIFDWLKEESNNTIDYELASKLVDGLVKSRTPQI